MASRTALPPVCSVQPDSCQWVRRKEPDAGWLISERAGIGRRGGATRVIERDTGLVMRFPSGAPPTLIMEEYAEVREDARPHDG
jgi:hypothetical protein